MDVQLDVLQVPAPVLLPLAVRWPTAGPHRPVLLPVQRMDGRVQPLDRDGRLKEEGAVLEGVPLPDPQVVRGRARRRVRAGAGPGGGLGGALWCVVSTGQESGWMFRRPKNVGDQQHSHLSQSLTIPCALPSICTLFISPRRWRSARYWQRRHSGCTVPMSINAKNWSEGLFEFGFLYCVVGKLIGHFVIVSWIVDSWVDHRPVCV